MSCNLCSEIITEITSYPDGCKDQFHYKCLRTYVDERIELNKEVSCPECNLLFGKIANKYKNSENIIYQKVVEDSMCGICFSKFLIPIAYPDCCNHPFCYECIRKWCTYKHECPMDRMPVKLLLVTEFPGGPILREIQPPPVEQDLCGDGENDEINNTLCEICNLGNNDELLLLCDSCNKGFHMYCLPEPLETIPEGDWYCGTCASNVSVNTDINDRTFGVHRGLGSVIADIENRFGSVNTINQLQSRRNLRSATQLDAPHSSTDVENENISTSRHRTARRRRDVAIDSDSEEIIRPVTRTRRVNENTRPRRAPRVLDNESESNSPDHSSSGGASQSVDGNSDSHVQRRRSIRVDSRRRIVQHRAQHSQQQSQSSEPESEEYVAVASSAQTAQTSSSVGPAQPRPVQEQSSSSSSNSSSSSGSGGSSEDSLEEQLYASSDVSYTPGQELRLPKTRVFTQRRRRHNRSSNNPVTSDTELDGGRRPVKRQKMTEDDDEEVNIRAEPLDVTSSNIATRAVTTDRDRRDSESSSLSTIPCTSEAIATRFETVRVLTNSVSSDHRDSATVTEVEEDNNDDSDFSYDAELHPSTSSRPCRSRPPSKQPMRLRKRTSRQQRFKEEDENSDYVPLSMNRPQRNIRLKRGFDNDENQQSSSRTRENEEATEDEVIRPSSSRRKTKATNSDGAPIEVNQASSNGIRTKTLDIGAVCEEVIRPNSRRRITKVLDNDEVSDEEVIRPSSSRRRTKILDNNEAIEEVSRPSSSRRRARVLDNDENSDEEVIRPTSSRRRTKVLDNDEASEEASLPSSSRRRAKVHDNDENRDEEIIRPISSRRRTKTRDNYEEVIRPSRKRTKAQNYDEASDEEVIRSSSSRRRARTREIAKSEEEHKDIKCSWKKTKTNDTSESEEVIKPSTSRRKPRKIYNESSDETLRPSTSFVKTRKVKRNKSSRKRTSRKKVKNFNITKKSKRHKKSTRRHKNTAEAEIKKFMKTIRKENAEDEFSNLPSSSQRLSILGRDRSFAGFADNVEASTVSALSTDKPSTSSGILAKISKDQDNLFHMTFSNINRMSDGTVVFKESEESTSNLAEPSQKYPASATSADSKIRSVSSSTDIVISQRYVQNQQRPSSSFVELPTNSNKGDQFEQKITSSVKPQNYVESRKSSTTSNSVSHRKDHQNPYKPSIASMPLYSLEIPSSSYAVNLKEDLSKSKYSQSVVPASLDNKYLSNSTTNKQIASTSSLYNNSSQSNTTNIQLPTTSSNPVSAVSTTFEASDLCYQIPLSEIPIPNTPHYKNRDQHHKKTYYTHSHSSAVNEIGPMDSFVMKVTSDKSLPVTRLPSAMSSSIAESSSSSHQENNSNTSSHTQHMDQQNHVQNTVTSTVDKNSAEMLKMIDRDLSKNKEYARIPTEERNSCRQRMIEKVQKRQSNGKPLSLTKVKVFVNKYVSYFFNRNRNHR